MGCKGGVGELKGQFLMGVSVDAAESQGKMQLVFSQAAQG